VKTSGIFFDEYQVTENSNYSAKNKEFINSLNNMNYKIQYFFLAMFNIIKKVNIIMKHIAIIGAGASGIIAALFAAKHGSKVTLFEKQGRIGRKILSSGNGRCNISNMHIDVAKYHGHNPEFVRNVYAKFGLYETIAFFESIGLPLIEETEGRLFPASSQASSVVDLLDYELTKNKIEIKLNRKVESIECSKSRFRIITAGKEESFFDSVILSAGSCANSGLGASDSGYELAKSFGHKVYEPFPAILPISIPLKIIHTLEGIKWNCGIKVEVKGKTVAESSGELLFTKYGISGPAALNVSRAVNQSILENTNPQIAIDFFPDKTKEILVGIINNLWTDSERNVSFSLTGIIKKRIPEVLLKVAGIDPGKQVKILSDKEKENIINSLKNFILTPGHPRSFKEAVIAAGGVDVNEINPSKMESVIIRNLYITGELLDIDGDSGGYNLQFAWSTGAVAGMAQE
jgi:predicted Rossmann fold flavoprotein